MNSVGETIAGSSFPATFTYDSYGRLSTLNHPSSTVETMNYNANGNISTKSDIGTTTFGYGNNSEPYALTSVSSSNTVIPVVSQIATYNSFQNTSNAVVAEYSFDAWGRRRNPTDWSYELTGQPELFAGRGFPGHEHLPWFNLVNMLSAAKSRKRSESGNGRMYDPAVGRFLNVDPFIQDPGNTQNYNRYSYCLNNPLKYTDPSGRSSVGIDNEPSSCSYGTYPKTVVYKIWVDLSGKDAQEGGGWYDNKGVYITGVALTVEDVYNNFGHNHTTYSTTGGVTKNIYKANGMLRSARAAQFATLSIAVSYAGTAGTALMTAQSGTKIYNGSATGLDYSDFTVGTTGIIGAFSQLGGYTIPGIGEGVALYGWGRLWFDLGVQYGPSKWYGNDENSWFK